MKKDIEETNKENSDSIKKETQEALASIPKAVADRVGENINKELMREGKIGTFMENI